MPGQWYTPSKQVFILGQVKGSRWWLGLGGAGGASPLTQGKISLGSEGALSQGGVMQQAAGPPSWGQGIGPDGVHPLLDTQAIDLGAQADSMWGVGFVVSQLSLQVQARSSRQQKPHKPQSRMQAK